MIIGLPLELFFHWDLVTVLEKEKLWNIKVKEVEEDKHETLSIIYLNSIKTEDKDPIQTIITTTDVLNVEQSGLILEGKNVETHKLELDWNI